MSYSVVATAVTPALVVYLIDVSGSMESDMGGETRIQRVNAAMKKILTRMVRRSTKGTVISPRYRLAMGVYSNTVYDVFNGIETIDKIAARGALSLSTMATTDTYAAFAWARDLLLRELPKTDGHPAPMVCHLTDGEFNGADPEPIAREIMAMRNADGEVLVENIYLRENLTGAPIGDSRTWKGIQEESQLGDDYARKLFRMSSNLPAAYADVIAEDGFAMQAGSRLLLPGSNSELLELAFAVSGATPTTAAAGAAGAP